MRPDPPVQVRLNAEAEIDFVGVSVDGEDRLCEVRPDTLIAGSRAQRSTSGWWGSEYGRWRLEVEVAAMGERFPRMRFFREQASGLLCWLGPVASSLADLVYVVKVRYGERFPDVAPRVTLEHPRLPPGTPHVWDPEAQELCLFDPAAGSRAGWDPSRTTAATLVAWSSLWLAAFETWGRTGRWPGRAHG